MLETVDLFPSKFFSFQFTDTEILQSIVEEVYSKKEKMTATSWAQGGGKSEDNYVTDYKNPQKIESFEVAFSQVLNALEQINLQYEMTRYWTALYKKFSIHELHEHNGGILQPINYSGILYLSDVGLTEFFTHNPSSFTNNVRIPSQYGRVILFPASIPHQVITDFDFNVERCVIAFNGIMRQ